MAAPSKATQGKRDRERSQREKQEEKKEKRAQRKEMKKDRKDTGADDYDPDLAGIVPGPQNMSLD